ncbi:MAG: hypothetical protein ACOY3I_10435 [Verrucomicrobiota bacterium]
MVESQVPESWQNFRRAIHSLKDIEYMYQHAVDALWENQTKLKINLRKTNEFYEKHETFKSSPKNQAEDWLKYEYAGELDNFKYRITSSMLTIVLWSCFEEFYKAVLKSKNITVKAKNKKPKADNLINVYCPRIRRGESLRVI